MKTNENQKSTNSQPGTQKPFIGAKPEQAFFSSVKEQSTPFFQQSATSKADVVIESVVQRMPAFESEVKDNEAVQRKFVNVSPIQAKLTIGESGDKYEQEADRVASQVVEQINAPAPAQSNQGQSVQGHQEKPEELQAKPEITALQRQEEKPEELQAKFTIQKREDIASGEASPDLTSAINSARGGGQSLDVGLQRSMGQAMGADFSGVRVHTDTQSDQLNRSIQAKAFTTGQDVFFRQGAYEPGSRGGQELIAHELTHVVQQGSGVLRKEARLIQRKLTQPGKNYKVCGPLTAISYESWAGFLQENNIENRFFPTEKQDLLNLYQKTKEASDQHKKSKGATTGNKLQQAYDQLILEATKKSISPGGEHWDDLLTAALDVIQPQPDGKYIKKNAADAAEQVWPKSVLNETFPEEFWKAVLSKAKPKPSATAAKVIPPAVVNVLKHAQTRYDAWVSGAEWNRGAWAGSDKHGAKPDDYESVAPNVIVELGNALPHNGWRLTQNSLSAEEQNSLHKYGGSAKGQDFIYHL